MNPLYKFLFFIILLIIMSVIFACDDEQQIISEVPSETNAINEYIIVRGDLADEAEIKAAVRLRAALEEIYGTEFLLETDWVRRGEDIPERREILVGGTNRSESAAAGDLRHDDYIIRHAGGRIVIAGGSPAATAEAVEYFIESCAGAPSFESIGAYEYRRNYEIPDPRIGMAPLGEYVIAVPSSDNRHELDTAERIRAYFLEMSGIELDIVREPSDKEHEILLGASADEDAVSLRGTLGGDGYAYGLYGGKLIITGGSTAGFRYGYTKFEEVYMKGNSFDLSENNRETGTAEYPAVAIYADAEKGSDSGDGSKASPFRTIKAVLGAAREYARKAPCDITVYLAGGDYMLDEPISLNADAFPCSHLSFRAESGMPVITAAVPVSGFYETVFNGVKAWAAPLPETGDGMLYPRQAFSSAGERLERPRLPAEGFYYVAGVPGYDEPFNTEYRVPMTEMNYNAGEIGKISNLSDVQIRMFHYWNDERLEIAEIDYDKKYIKFTNPSAFALKQESSTDRGAPYYLDNVPEAFGVPGEFYADRAAKTLYYAPRNGETPEKTVLYVPALTGIMTIDGMYGTEAHPAVTFDGITFTGSDWFVTARRPSQAATDISAAVTIQNGSHIAFERCRFTRIGTTAVEVTEGVSNLRFDHCDFYDLGGGGIHIAGTNDVPATEKTLHDIDITDCRIEKYGRVYANAVGILLRYAYDCRISHNEICDGFYSGISVGWVWGYGSSVTKNIIIEHNHIYNIGQRLLSDMGGIYTLGIQPGTVIRYNLIHDIQMACYGGWGIYPDEGSTDILIENNICYNMSAQPFHQHYGKNNIVRNNIFAFGEGGQFIITRKEEHNSLHLERNILLSEGTAIYAKAPGDMNMTDKDNLIWDYTGDAVSGYMDYDVTKRLYSFPAANRLKLPDMQKSGLYNGTIVADPLFADPKNGDFTPAENSPVFGIGFVPIDMSTNGIRD